MRMNRKRVPTGWELNGSRAPVGRVASAEPQFAAQTPRPRSPQLASWRKGPRQQRKGASDLATYTNCPGGTLVRDLAMASGRPMAFSPESWHSHSQEFATGR